MGVHAVDQARVDGDRNVRPVERRLEVRAVLARLGEEQRLLHFAFIVVPNVRLKPPSAVKNVLIAALRSLAVGLRAQLGVAGLVDLDLPASARA